MTTKENKPIVMIIKENKPIVILLSCAFVFFLSFSSIYKYYGSSKQKI